MTLANRPRVVLDSNILISALVFGGKPRQIIEWLIENGTIVLCTEIMTEVRRIVQVKFSRLTQELDKLEYLLRRDAVYVELGSISIKVCRDPDDDKIIETAIIGNCTYLVTGDKDLLVLKTFRNIKIVTPSYFFAMILSPLN